VHHLDAVFLPALRGLGLDAEVSLARWGWYPRGGGEMQARIAPCSGWSGLAWEARAPRPQITGVSAVSRLPLHIAERQRRRALERLAQRELAADVALVEDAQALGPGSLLFLAVAGQGARAGFSALGRRGVRAEAIADEAVDPLLTYLDSAAAVDDHLADQLLPFLALARTPSVFTCPRRSSHLDTVAWVIQQFLPARIEVADGPPARVRITPASPAPAARDPRA
jgi:RNA 3'-terminal phosphate cyclase (ATP)